MKKQKESVEKKRLRKKRLDEYYKLYNTTPPALTKEDSGNLSIGEIVKQKNINGQENYRVLHIKDTFTLNTFLSRVEYSDWINSIDDHLYRVADAVKNHESALLICRNKADMLKIITEVERCVNMKGDRENLA